MEKEVPDLFILQLADRFHKDPEEIEWGWSERSVERMRMYLDAVALAAELREGS